MKIGNRVRLLRGTEEGIVVALKGNKIVDVEIEDGFVIPLLINEVVIVDRSEKEKFPSNQSDVASPQNERIYSQISPGLYLGLKEISGNQYQTFFINHLSDTILFSISQNDKNNIVGKAYGICESFEAKEIGVLTSSIFNSAKNLLVHLIFHSEKSHKIEPPISIELELEKGMLAKKESIDSVEEEIYLIKIEKKSPAKIDPEQLREKMSENNYKTTFQAEKTIQTNEQVIDLHVDNLSSDMKSGEILAYQLNEFEKAYDKALLSSSEKLKIIHGIGAGILRSKIHKRLSSRKEIKFFEDADKDKFGFGSTIVYF